MESNAHRRSLGLVTLAPTFLPNSLDIQPTVLPSLTTSKKTRRLVPAIESRKKSVKKNNLN